MALFWILAALMTLAALAFVLVPLLRLAVRRLNYNNGKCIGLF